MASFAGSAPPHITLVIGDQNPAHEVTVNSRKPLESTANVFYLGDLLTMILLVPQRLERLNGGGSSGRPKTGRDRDDQ
jgi:hypothetical protein